MRYEMDSVDRTSKLGVPETKEFRDPETFAGFGDRWNEFLKRWNDKNITRQEALGLLHGVADRLDWDNSVFRITGEDSRQTCVRFLLYYAGNHADIGGWIQNKAYQVLTDKVLRSKYLLMEASENLELEVVRFLQNHLPKSQPAERHVEEFLRRRSDREKEMRKDSRRSSSELRNAWKQLANALFRSQHAFAEIFGEE